jgi:Uma2 family endonuclease
MKVDAEAPVAMQVSEEVFYSEEYEGSPYEYLDGELVVCEPVSTVHDDVGGFLYTIMRNVFEERGDGFVKGSRLPMRLDPKWSPEPDVTVVRAENVHRIGAQRIEGPADLVIEVVSPGDVRRALRLKLPRYRLARIPEIWVVDPYTRSVRVETAENPENPEKAVRVVTAGRLDSVVFPGFWIDVSWLWRQPLPPTLTCAHQILA